MILWFMNVKKDFPFFEGDYAYLDSACMSLKPKKVIEAVNDYNANYGSCAGRSGHKLSREVEKRINETRKLVRKFIGAKKDSEIIFTYGATSGLNILANHFKGKKVLISSREHNSNLIPWQKYAEKILVVGEKDYEFDLEDYESKIEKVDVVSVVYKSNLDGYMNPVKEIIKIAHKHKKLVILDAAQAVPHIPVNVKKLDVDYLVFSGHKLLGPTATGILYAKEKLVKELEPLVIGGGAVFDSTYDSAKFEEGPKRFEAGLQNYSGIFGLGEAIKYLEKIGMKKVESHSNELSKELYLRLKEMGVDFVGVEPQDKGIVSFNLKSFGAHDVALMLDAGYKIAVRSGAHCLHAWFNKHKLPGSLRVSFYLYNTMEDVDKFMEAIKSLHK
jgi:cysteine desulfurase / selenocysteine lyase